MASRVFHYAFLVRDLEEARRIYVDVLGGNTLELKAFRRADEVFAR